MTEKSLRQKHTIFVQIAQDWWMKKMCGFIAHVKATAPHCTRSHCAILQQALAVKKDSSTLKMLLDKIMNTLSFIMIRTLIARNFHCSV
jgi:hypothetical protein